MFKKGHKLNVGRKQSVQAIANIRSAKLGVKNPMFGKTRSAETRRKVSLTLTGRPRSAEVRRKISAAKKGANNPQWRGGVTAPNKAARQTAEYRAWRKAVFEKDNYTCQMCGKRGGKLNADHIKTFVGFPSLRFDVSNGRTLCEDPCHRSTDTYGNRPLNRAQRCNI